MNEKSLELTFQAFSLNAIIQTFYFVDQNVLHFYLKTRKVK